MGKTRRILKFLKGLLMLFFCGILLAYPSDGYVFVVVFLMITLLFRGISKLIYYFTMTRYMVDGLGTLYEGIIMIDLSLLVFMFHNLPQRSVMFYLVIGVAIEGVIDVLRALDAKRLGASWKYIMIYGVGEIVIAGLGIFFIGSARMLTYVFCATLIHTGVLEIVNSLKKSAIIYIG